MQRLSSLARDLRLEDEQGTTTGPTGGYDLSFVNDVDDDLKCVVCLDVMRDPYQIVPCGHRFCRTCLEQLIRSAREANRKPTCPNDRDEISLEQMFPDNNCKRKIMCLEVLCNNSSIGCDWHSTLSELEDHIAKTCPYVDSSCAFEGCAELFLRKHKEEHEANCRWRVVKCDFCSDDFRAFELEEHKNNVCPCQPIECPNKGCPILTPKNAMQNHVDNECLLSPKNCPVEFLGCGEKVTLSSMKEHMERNTHYHFKLLCGELQTMKSIMKESDNEKQALKEKLEAVTSKMETCKEQNEVLHEELKSTQLKMMESENSIVDLKQEIQQLRSNQGKFSNENKENLFFVWSVQDVNLLPLDQVIASPIYSTGPRGYCFCITLVRRYQGTTEILLRLLPGFYDHLLPWPFKCKFSLHLIDQSNNPGKANLLFKYDGEETPANMQGCFEKPDQNREAKPYQIASCSTFKLADYSLNGTCLILVKIEAYNFEDNLGI